VQASYRGEGGKAVRRMLASLGPHSTIDEALEALDSDDSQDRAILTARRWRTLSSEARAALGATERLQLEATERRNPEPGASAGAAARRGREDGGQRGEPARWGHPLAGLRRSSPDGLPFHVAARIAPSPPIAKTRSPVA
jgi:hypothetical protein